MRSITLCLLSLLFVTVAAMAAPFSDVPLAHWSYDAINQLAAHGILQGYPDGVFKGNTKISRQEMAIVTARLLADFEQKFAAKTGSNRVDETDLQTLTALVAEFADELLLIGVKTNGLREDLLTAKEDIAGIKNDVEKVKSQISSDDMEKVKLSGDMLVRHTNLTHKNDHAINPITGAVRAGNSDNSLTESMIGLTFHANIDENISAEVYWMLLDYHTVGVNEGQSTLQSAFGAGGIASTKAADSEIYVAFLEVKDMFRFGGDFVLGRNLYDHGHSLLLNNYIDVIRYSKTVGAVETVLQTIYDRHPGSYKDNGPVDHRGLWNLELATEYKKNNLYLGFYTQDEPNLMLQGRFNPLFAAPTAPFTAIPGAVNAAPVVGDQSSDKRQDLEFGAKGPIGSNGNWDYDLALAYTNYSLDVVSDSVTPWISPEMNGWMGHVALKWDSKKDWAAKLACTFADDESVGAISISNDMRYQDCPETPYEDISRGNAWFDYGLLNMSALKVQAEYHPAESKHYFRLASDMLKELKSSPVNDLNRHFAGDGLKNSVIGGKNNRVYDCWNSLGIADPEATVVTFEYRYQLSENSRIRIGYTNFDLTGQAQKASWTLGAAIPGSPGISAGSGLNDDFDYQMFWSEIYSTF